MVLHYDLLSCPLDGSALLQQGQSLYCASGHCFDIDRRGAVNLLPVQFKSSKSPDDSKEMVLARHRLLESGVYTPISDMLNQLIAGYIAQQGRMPLSVLDAGCGEGYYTARLSNHLTALLLEYALIGLDISKNAINEASKRGKMATWVIGTNNRLPILSRSINVIACLFGFPRWNEFGRVLKRRGLVITADPGPDHLIELRRILYPEIMEKKQANILSPGFITVAEHRLVKEISSVTIEQAGWILAMTPHNHRATDERKVKALAAPLSRLTLDVQFRLYALEDQL